MWMQPEMHLVFGGLAKSNAVAMNEFGHRSLGAYLCTIGAS